MLFKLFKQEMRVGVVGFLLVLLVSACSIGSPGVEIAQKAADDFYQAQQQKDMEKALTFFSSQRPTEDWRSHLEHLRDGLGDVQSYKMKKVEVNTVLSGRFYIFDYQVNYSSGKGAAETLTLFDSVDEGDTPLISSHTIAAEGFMPLF